MFALVAFYRFPGFGVEGIFRFLLVQSVLLTFVFLEGRLPFSFELTEVTLETVALIVKTYRMVSEVANIIGPVITVLLAAVENLRVRMF